MEYGCSAGSGQPHIHTSASLYSAGIRGQHRRTPVEIDALPEAHIHVAEDGFTLRVAFRSLYEHVGSHNLRLQTIHRVLLLLLLLLPLLLLIILINTATTTDTTTNTTLLLLPLLLLLLLNENKSPTRKWRSTMASGTTRLLIGIIFLDIVEAY